MPLCQENAADILEAEDVEELGNEKLTEMVEMARRCGFQTFRRCASERTCSMGKFGCDFCPRVSAVSCVPGRGGGERHPRLRDKRC